MTIPQALDIAIHRHRAGELHAAEQIYRQILQVNPNHAPAMHFLGVIAHQTGRHEIAAEYILRAIALDHRVADFHNNLATVYNALHRIPETITSARQALALEPGFAEAHNNLGNGLRLQGKLEDAAACYRRATELKPELAEAHRNLGDVLKDQGKLDEAAACYREALELDPGNADAHNNLGVACFGQRKLEEAVACYRRALEFKPALAVAHYNLGDALKEQGKLTEAVECYREALARDPDLADAHLNLGVTLRNLGHLPEAVASTRRALALKPDLAQAHYNLGMYLLQLGEYEEGWRECEHRLEALSAWRRFSTPRWNGGRADGCAILIHHEQGLGDALQFLRYAPIVRRQTGAQRVILETKRELVRLLAESSHEAFEIAPAPAADEPAPAGFDFHVPLMSLPLALGLFEPLPMAGEYIQANPELRQAWRERLGAASAIRVGLAWAGNPENRMDRQRSIAAEELRPLLQFPGIQLYSLQVGPPSCQWQTLAEAGLIDFMRHIADFADTAALASELDLIISVDTAVAHLAGAMGRPVWTLLPFAADWRWGMAGDTTPWYPTMRLFRQPKIGDWASVIEQVAAELPHLTQHPPTPIGA